MVLKTQKRLLAFLLALVLLLSTFASTAVVSVSAAEADVNDTAADVAVAEEAAHADVVETGANTYVAIDGYPDPAVENLTITTSQRSGNVYPWVVTTVDGAAALKSTNNGVSSSFSHLKLEVAASGLLTFQYKTSSEANWDILAYKKGSESTGRSDCINSGDMSSYSGTRDWSQGSIVVEAGDVYYLTYTKDGSGNSGDDTVWVKDFSLNTDVVQTSINIVSNTEFGWIGTSSSAGKDTAISSFTGLSGMTQTFFAVPDAFHGWDFEGLYTDPNYTPESKVACVRGDSHYGFEQPTVDHYREFTVAYPDSGTATYYAKFVQKPDSEKYTITLTYDDTNYSDVYFYVIGELYDHYCEDGWGNIDTRYTIPINSGDTVTLYKGFQTHIKYTFTDTTGNVADIDAQYTVDGTAYTFEQGCILGVSEENEVKLPHNVTMSLEGFDNSFTAMSGIDDVFADADSADKLAVSTRRLNSWQLTSKDSQSVLASSCQGVSRGQSSLKLKPSEAGLLSFDYKTSTEANYDALFYHKGTTEPRIVDYANVDCDNESEKAKWSGEQDWTSFSIVLQEGDELNLSYLKDGYGNEGEDTVWIKNIKYLTGKKSITCQVNDAERGTVMHNDALVTNPVEEYIGTQQTFTATPKDGYQFLKWEKLVNGEWQTVSDNAEYTFTLEEDVTIKASFAPALNGTAIASVYGAKFGTLEDAFAVAGSGDTVVLIDNYTQPANITIPAGVTLLLPYEADATTVNGADALHPYANTIANGNNSNITQPGTSLYKKLTLSENKTITVPTGAKLVVGGKFSGAQPIGCATYGTHSEIALGSGAKINVTGGILSNFGYITGSGEVNLNSGNLYEPFTVTDYHGGTYTAVSYGKDENQNCPFNTYTMMNVRSKLNMDSSSNIYGYCSLYASSAQNMTCAKIVGHEGAILNLADGTTATFTYDATKKVAVTAPSGATTAVKNSITAINSIGRTNIELNGNVTLGYLSLDVGMEVSTDTVDFSVPYNYSITQKSGTLSVPYSYKLLPGAELTIDQGATLTIPEPSGDAFPSLFVYDGMAARVYSASYAYPSSAALSAGGLSERARLTVNGTLNIEAHSSFAGVVENDGTSGTINIDKNAYFGNGDTYESFDGTIKGDSYIFWTSTTTNQTMYELSPQVLLNTADGPELIDMTRGATYKVSENVSLDTTQFTYKSYDDNEEATEVTASYTTPETISGSWGTDAVISFDSNGGSGSMASIDTITGKVTDLPDNTFTKTKDSFLGWNTKADGTGKYYKVGEPVIVTEDTPLYAVWLEPHHSLTLDGKIGVNFYVKLPAGYDETNTTMDFTWGNKYISTHTYSETEHYSETGVVGKADGANTKYTVYIAAKELTDDITAVLKDTQGNVIATDIYSGADYAYDILSRDSLTGYTAERFAQLQTLCRSLLIYASKSQLHLEYNTSDLADKDLGSYTLPAVDTGALKANDMSALPSGLQYYGTALNLGSETSYDICIVNRGMTDLTTSAVYDGSSDTVSTSVTNNQIAYIVKVENLPAARITDTVSLTINSGTVKVTTEDYIKNVLTQSTDNELKVTVTALYDYCKNAKAFFNN